MLVQFGVNKPTILWDNEVVRKKSVLVFVIRSEGVARLAPKVLNLNDCERDEMQQLINRHNTPQQIALRAKIVLLASSGKNHREIARTLGIGVDMARLWRNRWLETSCQELSVTQRLQDLERVGAPVKFSMEQVIELLAKSMFATRRLRTTNKSLDTNRTGR